MEKEEKDRSNVEKIITRQALRWRPRGKSKVGGHRTHSKGPARKETARTAYGPVM